MWPQVSFSLQGSNEIMVKRFDYFMIENRDLMLWVPIVKWISMELFIIFYLVFLSKWYDLIFVSFIELYICLFNYYPLYCRVFPFMSGWECYWRSSHIIYVVLSNVLKSAEARRFRRPAPLSEIRQSVFVRRAPISALESPKTRR